MEKIASLEQFSSIVKEFKKCFKRTETNCYFLPKEIEEYCQLGKMRFMQENKTLYFLIDEGLFDRFYFFIPKGEGINLTNFEKTAVLDTVYKNNKGLQEQEFLYSRLRDAGFKDYSQYQRMRLKLETFRKNLTFEKMEKEYQICMGDVSKTDEIHKLWGASLDLISTPLPDFETLSKRIKLEQVLYVMDNKGYLIAALQWIPNGDTCLIQHVAVDQSNRKKGLGEYMLYNSLKIKKDSCYKNCILWVDVKNEAALNLYKKYGFEEDKIESKQFIYKIKENRK